MIYDKKRFAADILPQCFKQTQFTSFTRKLSRWRFTRVNRGPLMGAYYHTKFQKDCPAQCRLMSCQDNTEGSQDQTSINPPMTEATEASNIYIPSYHPQNTCNEDMLSLFAIEKSVEVSIAKEGLNKRRGHIDSLLQVQRCKQACRILRKSVNPNLRPSHLDENSVGFSIAEEDLNKRQGRIDSLLRVQRREQACRILGNSVDPNLRLSHLDHTQPNSIMPTDNAPYIGSFDIDNEVRARMLDQDRLLVRSQFMAQSMLQQKYLAKSMAQSHSQQNMRSIMLATMMRERDTIDRSIIDRSVFDRSIFDRFIHGSVL